MTLITLICADKWAVEFGSRKSVVVWSASSPAAWPGVLVKSQCQAGKIKKAYRWLHWSHRLALIN